METEHLGTEVTMAGGPGSQQASPTGTWKQQGLFPLWNHLLPQHLPVLLGTSDGTWPACCQLGAEGRGCGAGGSALLQGLGLQAHHLAEDGSAFPLSSLMGTSCLLRGSLISDSVLGTQTIHSSTMQLSHSCHMSAPCWA